MHYNGDVGSSWHLYFCKKKHLAICILGKVAGSVYIWFTYSNVGTKKSCRIFMRQQNWISMKKTLTSS